MNTVKLSVGSLFGLAAIACCTMVFGVALFGASMVAFHPSSVTKKSDCECPGIAIPEYRGQAVSQFQAPLPVNSSALNEIKQQGGTCLPCNQQRRPNYVQPSYVQPSYVRPAYPVVQPSNPVVVTPTPRIVPQPAPIAPTAKYQIALFLDGSPQSVLLRQWFDTDPQLVALRNRCAFEVYTPENALYKTRYANIVPTSQFPAALFLYPDGGHIHAAGKNTIPRTASELYSDFKLGFDKAKSVRSAAVPATDAVVKTRGYSWDSSVHPSMRLANEQCVDGNCDQSRWVPGQKIADLFDSAKDAKSLVVWGGTTEIVIFAMLGLVVVMGGVLLLLVFVKRARP